MLWGELKENGAVRAVPEARMKMRGGWCARARFPYPSRAPAFREYVPVCSVSAGLSWPNDGARIPCPGVDRAQ